MKKLRFILILFIGIALTANAEEALTEYHIKSYKDGAESFVENYYTVIDMLIDLNLTYSERKDITYKFMNDYYGGDDSKMIGNDLQMVGLNKDFYSIRDYVQMLTQTKNEIEIYPQNITTSELYVNEVNQKVLLVSFDRFLSVSPTENKKVEENKVEVNMLLEVLSVKGEYKVIDFGLAKNSNNPLKGYSLVKPSKEEPIKEVSNKPHFITSIYPIKSKLFIDEEEVDFINGIPIPVSPGYHDIKVEASDYETRKMKKLVGDNGEYTLNIQLDKQKGTLDLYIGADFLEGQPVVIVNQQTKRETRATLPVYGLELEDGVYKIHVMGPRVASPGSDKVVILSGKSKSVPINRTPKEVQERRKKAWGDRIGNLFDTFTTPSKKE
ncbi:MAG: hypothetical protein M9887_01985 [Chitinophagales bacterium]|nr:hypothetical protein [Chitinophagales bacterium]